MEVIVCNGAQDYVMAKDLSDWARLFDFLMQNGYKNPHELIKENMPKLSVVCVDKRGKFFCSVNVTVMACVSSQGKKVISVSDFLG